MLESAVLRSATIRRAILAKSDARRGEGGREGSLVARVSERVGESGFIGAPAREPAIPLIARLIPPNLFRSQSRDRYLVMTRQRDRRSIDGARPHAHPANPRDLRDFQHFARAAPIRASRGDRAGVIN